MAEKTKKKKEPISSFSILLILLVVLAVISWIAAAATGGTVTAASLSNILTSPIYGFTGAPTDIVEGAANPDTFPGGALEVCFFVMILGGFLGVMTKTGALDNGIAVLVKKLKGNELVLIPILMILFSIGGTTYGMCEETVPASMRWLARQLFCWVLAAVFWALRLTRSPLALRYLRSLTLAFR